MELNEIDIEMEIEIEIEIWKRRDGDGQNDVQHGSFKACVFWAVGVARLPERRDRLTRVRLSRLTFWIR